MKEREISLIDLIVEILLRWRVITVWMLVGGIMMGTYSFANSYRTQQAQLAAKAVQEQEKEQLASTSVEEYLTKALTAIQINNVNMAMNYEAYVAERRKYLEESLLMQVDALQVPQSRLTFCIVGTDDNRATNLVRIYEDLILSDMLEWLEKEAGAEYTANNYSEAISLDRSSRGLENGVNSFCIDIVHVTKELSVELADMIVRYMSEQQMALQNQLGDHTVEVVSQSFTYVVDNVLMTTQRTYRNEVTSNIAAAEKLKVAFSPAEKAYYDYLVLGGNEKLEEIQGEAGSDADVTIAPAAVNIKFVILGMILFAFVYVFYVFLKYIMNTKLRVIDDMKELYGIAQLGAVPATERKQKVFAFVDKWILKLRNYNKRVFSEEEAVGLAAVAVKMAAKKENMNAVYCIGCDVQEKTVAIAGQISEILDEDNISFTLLNNVLYNQENMAKLADAKAVVLMEKVGETLYEEIANELEILQRQEIKVLGAIIVE